MKKGIKVFSIIIGAVIFSIIIQSIILYIIQSHYVETKLTVNFNNVTEDANMTIDIEEEEIKVPEGSKIISVSNKGEYILYELNKEAYMLNIKTRVKNKIGITINLDTFFKWNDEEEKLIIARNSKDNKAGFEVLLYNPSTNNLQEALDASNNHVFYTLYSLNEKITDIKINNMNTIIYLKIDDGENQWINRLDISGQTNRLNLNTNNIGNFEIINSTDEIIFKNNSTSSIEYKGTNGIGTIDMNGKLLAEYNNVCYIGKIENNKISKLYYKDLSSGYKFLDKFNEKVFDEPYNTDNLLITNSNNIYSINRENNMLTNINSNIQYKYRGEFITIVNDKAISILNNSIKIKDLTT